MARAGAVALATAMLAGSVLAVACGTDAAAISGVVVDVQGDITTVEEFTVRLPDGSEQRLVPAPGVVFHGGAAIGHLRDHLRSGQPVEIEYEILDDGTWVAHAVDDG